MPLRYSNFRSNLPFALSLSKGNGIRRELSQLGLSLGSTLVDLAKNRFNNNQIKPIPIEIDNGSQR